MAEIFISYRHGDDRAEQVCSYLNQELYPNAATMDVKWSDLQQFRPTILNLVRQCQVLIVIIGKTFEGKMKALSESNDMLREEMKLAIDSGKRIILLRVDEINLASLNWPAEFKELANDQQHYVDVSPGVGRPAAEMVLKLPTLIDALTSHLTSYWQRKTRQARTAAWVFGVGFSLVTLPVVLALVSGVIWYFWLKSTNRDIQIVELPRQAPGRERLQPNIPIAVDRVTKNFRQKWPEGGQRGLLAEYDMYKLDLWLEYFKLGLDRVHQKGEFQLFVISAEFGSDYQAGMARLSYPRRFKAHRFVGFLKGKSQGGSDASRPTYRQLKPYQEWSTLREDPGLLAIELSAPNRGEQLLLFVILKKEDEGEWPKTIEEYGFKLES